jgi:hypothetical protein
MFLSFDATVSALAESIIRERCAGTDADRSAAHLPVASFLLDTHARMPDYLRLPLQCLTLGFDAWALLSTGRPFHRLPHDRRWRQIRAWKESALGFRRDLIKFYETLAVFGWYSELYGEDYAHAADPGQRRAERR